MTEQIGNAGHAKADDESEADEGMSHHLRKAHALIFAYDAIVSRRQKFSR